jgi:ubiquinone/menaquinone biosynthesis C-methylase UbiE
VFASRSYQLERIDTGDYTAAEYELFLREIRFINRFLGDDAALRKTLLQEIETKNLREFSVLDIGAGSGELLRTIAVFARGSDRKARLCGLDLNEISIRSVFAESKAFAEIGAVRGDGLDLPFADRSFDYAICSLFTHHLTDENVVRLLTEMERVSRRGVFVIDLHRHRAAYFLYKIFCAAFRISPLVREDGLLSIRRSFKSFELKALAEKANLKNVAVERHLPFRLVLKGN